MSAETDILTKVEEHLQNKGWKIVKGVRARGREIDVVGIMGADIAAVEVKGSGGNMQRGIEQALHQKRAVDFSYLAIPYERSSPNVTEICKNLGIGLLLVNNTVREAVKPARGRALPSVRRIILGEEAGEKKAKPAVSVQSSLEYLFRNTAQILILKLFFLNPNSEFHVHEIARRTGLSASYVTKETKKIEAVGIVSRRRQGNLVLFRINPKCVIFDELKRIFLKYELLDEMIAKALPRKKMKYALIYGSFAKGTEREGSDIDLLVVGSIDDDRLIRVITDIESRTGREINYILWSEYEFRKKAEEKVSLLQSIAANPVIMVIGDEDEFRRSIER